MSITNKKAFTLIELLVVVLIIGILAAIALPQYQKAVLKSKISSKLPLLKSLADAQERYRLVTGDYATSFDALDISIAGCSGQYCQAGDDYLRQPKDGNIALYLNSTTNDTTKLTVLLVYDETAFNAVESYTVKKGQFLCFDRNESGFRKACQSFSDVSVDASNGKVWLF